MEIPEMQEKRGSIENNTRFKFINYVVVEIIKLIARNIDQRRICCAKRTRRL